MPNIRSLVPAKLQYANETPKCETTRQRHIFFTLVKASVTIQAKYYKQYGYERQYVCAATVEY